MIRRNQTVINLLNIVSDYVLVLLAYQLAVVLRFDFLDGTISAMMNGLNAFLVASMYAVAVVLLYYVQGMYGSYRFKRAESEAFTVLLTNGVAAMLFMAMFFILRLTDFSRWALVFLWGISSLLILLKRAVVRSVLQRYQLLGYGQKHAVVVGNGRLAHQYMLDMKRNPQFGVVVDGYVSGVEKPELGTCLGSYEQLEQILEQMELDELVVALEPHEVQYMRNVLSAADKEGVRVNLIPFFNDYIPTHPTIEAVGKTKLIDLRATPLDNLGWSMAKRCVDILGSLALILVTGPLMLVAAVGVKLSSPGPILFKQERIGKDKKPFSMYKFRSMRTDIDHTGWSVADDPRKTKFGSFIRKYSIDELPQLFNVLKGDMSLVGPRPELPRYVRQFKEEVPLYLVRQQVRPGMTGWAQVNGLRGDTSIEDRVKFDIWYIQNWSFWLDIKILFKTAFGGFINREESAAKRKKKKRSNDG